MLFNRNKGSSIARISCLLGFLVSVAGLQAGDKIQFSEPTRKTELPKAGPKLEEFSRSYDFLDRGSEGPAGALNIPPAPNQSASPANLKKLEEFLDKKKNWIFENARESASSGQRGGNRDKEESGSNFEGRRESVMESFFAERDRNGRAEGADNRAASSPFDPGTSFFRPNDNRYGNGTGPGSPNMEFNLSGYLRNDRGSSGENETDRRFIPNDALSPFNTRVDNFSAEKRMERERAEELRRSEFQKLLQPRNLTPSVGGTVDVLNRQVDTTRQEANPIAPRTFGSPLAASARPESSSAFPSPLTAARGPIEGTSVAESMRVQNPVVNPLQAGSIAPAAPAATFTPAPFILDIQRRKF